MVATYPSASPRSWRSASRMLGALFAGSAMMFAAAVLHGGSLLTAGDDVRPVAEPLAERTGATSAPATATGPGTHQTPAVRSLVPGQAAAAAPGAAPEWGAPLRELPVRAPVQEAPQRAAAASTAQGTGHSDTGVADSWSRGGPTTQPAEEPDRGMVNDVLGSLGLGR